MRTAFVNSLLRIMDREHSEGIEKTCLIVGDLGFSVFEELKERYPRRFLNAGVSEQNMAGISSGMAMLGKNVFIYSIIPFVLYRAFEQIRNDICYHNLPVRIIGVGAGLAYADAGATHHPIEDLRVAGSIPNLTILNPSDPKEVETLMGLIEKIQGPVYMRLARNGDPVLHDKHSLIRIGKALKLTGGQQVLIITGGTLTKIALDAANELNKDEDVVEVLEIHTFKPFDNDAVKNASTGKKVIVTIEDNNGALEEKVAAALAGTGSQRFISFKLPDQFTHVSGTRDYLFSSYGITPDNICKRIREALK